ncbi:MAG: maleate isomerase [Chloroflexota bacterium]|jgi:maleate isomerase|nr:maleate isomerase [Chloroflexota bacterium]
METEVPALLRRREDIRPERFTFHSSRARMRTVSADELARMADQSERCAAELADARVDVIAYACLVAVMAGKSGHRAAERQIARAAAANGADVPVVSSAGALVEGLRALGARRVAIVAPYVRSLTATVCDYIAAEGVEVVDSISLEVPDNLAVGRIPATQIADAVRRLDRSRADVLVLSACVQMPSLAILQAVEDEVGLPTLSAASATTYAILRALDLEPIVPGAGRLLAGGVALRS